MFGFVPSCLNHSTTPRNIGSANTRFCSPVTLFLRGVAGAVAGCSTIALHEMSRQSQLTLSDHESRIPGAPLCTLVRACEYPSLVQLLASKRDSIRPLRAVKRHALALHLVSFDHSQQKLVHKTMVARGVHQSREEMGRGSQAILCTAFAVKNRPLCH